MANFLLDTNILIIYGRNTGIANRMEQDLNLFSSTNNLGISVVTLGEFDSLARQFNYGEKRQAKIKSLVEDLFVIDLNIQKIIERYGEIDAYSQGKLSSKPLDITSRNMGKNDLWISATASVYNMTLVTTDKDFSHLDSSYLDLNLIDISKYE